MIDKAVCNEKENIGYQAVTSLSGLLRTEDELQRDEDDRKRIRGLLKQNVYDLYAEIKERRLQIEKMDEHWRIHEGNKEKFLEYIQKCLIDPIKFLRLEEYAIGLLDQASSRKIMDEILKETHKLSEFSKVYDRQQEWKMYEKIADGDLKECDILYSHLTSRFQKQCGEYITKLNILMNDYIKSVSDIFIGWENEFSYYITQRINQYLVGRWNYYYGKEHIQKKLVKTDKISIYQNLWMQIDMAVPKEGRYPFMVDYGKWIDEKDYSLNGLEQETKDVCVQMFNNTLKKYLDDHLKTIIDNLQMCIDQNQTQKEEYRKKRAGLVLECQEMEDQMAQFIKKLD